MDTKIKNKIRDKMKEALYYDSLLDYILTDTAPLPDEENLEEPGTVMNLVCAARQNICSPLDTHLQTWYHDFKYDPWHNGHGIFDYWGKWSFEAAAIAKKSNLNDEHLKDDPFYPYDLAHFEG